MVGQSETVHTAQQRTEANQTCRSIIIVVQPVGLANDVYIISIILSIGRTITAGLLPAGSQLNKNRDSALLYDFRLFFNGDNVTEVVRSFANAAAALHRTHASTTAA